MARIPYATRDEFPEELKYVWDAVAGESGPPNIFRTLGNSPQLLRAYLRLGNGLWNHCGLNLQTRELAILRSALNKRSAYEWHQHVRIGRDAGLSDEKINALHDWASSDLFDAREKALLAYVDAIGQDSPPPQQTLDDLIAAWDRPTAVGVSVLVPFYEMTAKFLAAMDVQPEDEFVGWTL